MIAEHVTCQMLVEQATDWMEGALAPETAVELELHLATCDGCAAYLEQLRATRQALSRLGGGPPEPGVRQNLLALFRQRAGPADGASY
jgi:anti-sigma factor RsiW